MDIISIQELWNKLTAAKELTPWSTVLPEKLTGPQIVKKFPHFMEPEGSLSRLQVPPPVHILSQINPVRASRIPFPEDQS